MKIYDVKGKGYTHLIHHSCDGSFVANDKRSYGKGGYCFPANRASLLRKELERKTFFEEMGGTYRQEGDCRVPDLKRSDTEHYQIGKYGHLRQTYLREHRPVLYNTMFLNGTLNQHLAETDQICSERMERMVAQMAEREGVIEALKASAQLEWVGRMNNIRNRAEEIVLAEVVYA